MKNSILRLTIWSGAILLIGIQACYAQNTPCRFDPTNLMFVGSPNEQARCLLRQVKIGGELGPVLPALPDPLRRLVGHRTKIAKKDLARFLRVRSIRLTDLGGSLNEPLATANQPGRSTSPATYFVIHDTSWPYFGVDPFPENADFDPDWRGNALAVWKKNPVAHVFVNRLGESLTTTPFSLPVAKGFGTKFARDNLRETGKGLQLHIELMQPRRRDANVADLNNDRIAPVPGFTDKQYERLALLYICASVRRGRWLIPAFHAAMDAGIKGAHDDPQNFDLAKFNQKLKEVIGQL